MDSSKQAGPILFFVLMFLMSFHTACAQAPWADLNGITIGSEYDAVLNSWGTPNRVIGEYQNGCGLLNFKNSLFLANFVNGRLWNLSVQFDEVMGPENGASRQITQALKKQLLPPDSVLIKHTRQRNGSAWDEFYRYRSQSLIGLFQPNDFYDIARGKNVPGEFLVVVSFNEKGTVIYLSIGVGNNP